MIRRNQTNRIIWHCTATPEGRDVTYDDLWRWHVSNNGWSHIGYHYLIQLDGTKVTCRPEEMQGAGVNGHNADSVHVCYAGGLEAGSNDPKDTRTTEQILAMKDLTLELLNKYSLSPESICGHNEFAAKACPSFDVKKYVQSVVEDAENGNPETGDPDFSPIGLYIKGLEERLEEMTERLNAVEAWAMSFGGKNE